MEDQIALWADGTVKTLRPKPRGIYAPEIVATQSGICPWCHVFIRKGSRLVRLPSPIRPWTTDGRKCDRTGDYWYYDGRIISTHPRQYVHRQCYLNDALEDADCTYCGGAADCWDHVVPKHIGGGDELTNLVPACTPCNSRKSCMPAELLDADTRQVSRWLLDRGFVPVVPNRMGKTSSWRDPAEPHRFYTRRAAVLVASEAEFWSNW